MRVHVTGAIGFLGTELLRLAPGATRERVEVRDREAVLASLERVRPDVVIHTAYRQDGDGAREIVVVRRAPAPAGRPLDCSLDSTRAASLLRTELRGARTVFA